MGQTCTPSVGNQIARMLGDLKEGVEFVLGHPGRWQLFTIVGVLNFFMTPFFVMMPEFVVEDVGVGEDWAGYTMAAYGFGSLLGAGVAGLFSFEGRSRGISVMVGLPLVGFLLVSLSISGSVALTLIFALLLGAGLGFVGVVIRTLLQLTTPDEFRGRMFGLFQTVVGALSPVGFGACAGLSMMVRSERGVASVMLASAGIAIVLCAILGGLCSGYRAFLCQCECNGRATTSDDGPTASGGG